MDQNYSNYLDSDEWKELRQRLIQRSGGNCEICGDFIGKSGQVHHISYGNLFEEGDEDVEYVCKYCHSGFSNSNKWCFCCGLRLVGDFLRW